jgi:multidrug efflux pump subunit AcrA (membrane-fusion protein)
MKSDNTVELRQVRQGQRQDGDMQVIEDGLKAGETVVVIGQLALAPGMKVDPKPYNPPGPSQGGQVATKASM